MQNYDAVEILRTFPLFFLIILPDEGFTIADASDDYLIATHTQREELVGRSILEVLPDDPLNVDSNGERRLLSSLRRVRDTGQVDAMDAARESVSDFDEGTGKKHWLATNYPVKNASGAVAYILHRVQDVTYLLEASVEHPALMEAPQPRRRASDLEVASKYDSPLPQIAGLAAAAVTNQSAPQVTNHATNPSTTPTRLDEILADEDWRWVAAEAKAAEAGEKLALAVEAADLGTFYCPMPLGVIVWNDTCKKHFYLAPDAEVDFTLFYQMLHPDDREPTRLAIDASIFRREPYDVEYRVVAPDGRMRWVRAKGRAYYGVDGTPTRFDGITIDISRQKEAEAQLIRSDRQKDDFLAMLAHELRNPLAPISAAAQLMTQGHLNLELGRKSAEIISRQVGHMTSLVDDLLDVSRVTRGLVEIDNMPVCVQDVVNDALEQNRPLASKRGHTVELKLPSTPLTVLGDRKRLVQIVANLLNNSAKYTPEGGRISVQLSELADKVVLKVIDNGCGISRSLLPNVFDLFTQEQRTPDRALGGLGLGLALVKSLTELHHGSAHCDSDGFNRGSTFTITLPRHQIAPEANHQLPPQAIEHAAKSLNILVVDDNVDVAQMLAIALQTFGHRVQIEHDSSHALERVFNAPMDVCFVDIGLPVIDGNEVARRIRANPVTAKMPLIAVTGYCQAEDIRISLEAGFDTCLSKPVELTQITSLLAKLSGG